MAEGQTAPSPWLPLAAVLLVVLVGLVAALGTLPPDPAPADAPLDRFSATRAREVLDRVLGDKQPHPVGSAENGRVRQRIVDELRRLGFTPELSKNMSCGRSGACAEVTNILASVPGRSKDGAVLLAAHYDSVGAGPGASDDGAGVASLLEIARILKLEPPRQRPVALLFDDGEEPGLLGAQAFVKHNPLAHRLSAAINLEARGTSGPSLMFETSGRNAALARALAESLPHPVTSSVFASVYRELPNDTDLTVFRRAGIAGVNFAFIGNEPHYHTPLDDLDHSSAASLQHEGGSALALARKLADGAPVAASSDAVFFDVLGFCMVEFPVGWMVPLLVVAALSLALAGFFLKRRGAFCFAELGAALAVLPLGWLLAGSGGALLHYVLHRAGALPLQFVAHPLPALVACWALGALGTALPAALLARRVGLPAFWLAGGVWLLALTALILARLPGAGYLTELPLIAMAVAGLLWAAAPGPDWRAALAVLAPVAIAAIVWMPILLLLYDALGFVSLPLLAAVIALAWAPLVPALCIAPDRLRWAAVLGALSALLIATPLAARAAPFSPELPERVSLVLDANATTHRARWLTGASQGPLPPALLRAGSFSPEPVSPAPWSGGWNAFALSGPAPDPGLPAPDVERVPVPAAAQGRRVRVSIRSLRGARDLALVIPAGTPITAARVDGTPAYFRRRGEWKRLLVLGAPPDGVEVELDLATEKRIQAVALDRSPGLPGSGKALLRARPRRAVPSQDGDLTLVSRHFALQDRHPDPIPLVPAP